MICLLLFMDIPDMDTTSTRVGAHVGMMTLPVSRE